MGAVEMYTARAGSSSKKFSCKREAGDRTTDEGKQRFVFIILGIF